MLLIYNSLIRPHLDYAVHLQVASSRFGFVDYQDMASMPFQVFSFRSKYPF